MRTTDASNGTTILPQTAQQITNGPMHPSSHEGVRDHLGNVLSSQLYKLHGLRAVSVEGDEIGLIGWVWSNEENGQGEFVGVGLHWLRGTVRALPAAGTYFDARTGTVRLPYTKSQLKSARRFKIDRGLTVEQKQSIWAHYEIEPIVVSGLQRTEPLAA